MDVLHDSFFNLGFILQMFFIDTSNCGIGEHDVCICGHGKFKHVNIGSFL